MKLFSGLTLFSILLCLTITADESNTTFKLGERFFNDSLYNLALEQYQRYVNLKKHNTENDPVAYFKIAVCHFKMGNILNAAEEFEEYIRQFPMETNIMEVMYRAGIARKKHGDYKEASDWFYSVWSRFVGSAKARSALFEAAQCAESDNDFDRAIELYLLYFKKFPKKENSKHAAIALVKLHIDRKEYSQTEKILGVVEKQWKSDKEFHLRILFYKALLAKRMQKISQAEILFRQMKENDLSGFPEMIYAYREYIDLLSVQKKYKQSCDIFKKLSQIFKTESKTIKSSFLLSWADNARRGRLYKDAVSLYEKVRYKNKSEVNIYQIRFRIAQCLVGMEKLHKALEILRTLELEDTTGKYGVRAVLKTGELYYEKQLYPSAIAAYRRYLQLLDVKDKDRIIFRIGKIYQKKFNRYGAAQREFENIIKWYPASRFYQRSVYAIAECQESLKEYQKAARNYDYLYETGGDNDLVEKAKKRAEYIRNFLIKDSDAAVYDLAELVQEDPASITDYVRLYRLGIIFEKYLKDYTKALDIYDEIEKIQYLPDSTKAKNKLHKARVFERLHGKAVFDKNPKMAEYSKKMALKHYNTVLNDFSSSTSADEAAYNIMVLSKPNINEYEKFIKKYPGSKYVSTIYLSIAGYYERHTNTIEKRSNRKALNAYREIVIRYPSGKYVAQSLIGLSRNYMILGLLDSAENTILKFIEQYSNSELEVEAYFIQGLVAGEKGDFEKAVDLFKQVLYQYPFSLYAERSRYEVANAERKTGKIFEALSSYRLYIQNFVGGVHFLESRYGIAKCLYRLDKIDEAVLIFNELIDNKELSEVIISDIHYELSQYFERKGKIYKALKHYKAILSMRSQQKKKTILQYMGNLYFDNRIFDDAADCFTRALKYAENESDTVVFLGRSITALIMGGKKKKVDRIIKNFKDRFGEKYPNDIAEVIFYEATYLIAEKNYDKSINRFKYIIQKFEKSERLDDAAYNVALCVYYKNEINKALDLFRKFIIEYPDSEFIPLAYFKIAMIFHGQNDFVQSAQYFSKVINQNKVDSKTRFRAANNAAIAYQKVSSWHNSAKMYRIVLNDYGDRIHKSSYHLKIGFCFLQASKVENALKHFKKADKDPKKEDKPEIVYWKATCYSKLGDHGKAIAEYLKVPYLYSGAGKWGVTAEFEAARLYERKGEYNKAITLYRKIIRSDGEQGRFGKRAVKKIQRLNILAEEGD